MRAPDSISPRRSLEQAAFNRQYSRIYAPADGFISHKLGNAGELAAPGAPVLVMQAVSASSQWVLRCGLADKEWAALETGNPVTLRFDAFPGKTFPGTVSRKSLFLRSGQRIVSGRDTSTF